ncbi:MAG TPA: MFS transporter [Spirochaetota bacterium]|nr:MFS transporter [Spirochaetota bacterium]HPV43221.1 MFS transporter [Spirochaetota bacterium]
MGALYRKIAGLPRDFILFILAIALIGFSQSAINSVFNNYLNEIFHISNNQRGMLELPREMPGFLVVFFSALFFFMSARRLAAFANFLAAAGVALIGLMSPTYSIMLVWLLLYSMGQHIYLPLNQSLGMDFAREGNTGRRLGQLTGAMNIAAIAGSFLVFVGFKYLHFNFTVSFVIASLGFLVASALLFLMKPGTSHPAKTKFTMRKEYRLFYWLNILYGTRKQIFLTFAPWVLIKIFDQKTEMVATLLTVGGITGIFFNPLLGRAIDRLGERRILMGEAALLIIVCAGYGFSKTLFGETTALLVAFACFVADQLLMSVGMARATYLKKIAVKPEDVSQTLTMGVSIDHLFSIAIALVGGVIWDALGYQFVFLIGAVIALVNLFSASRVMVGTGSAGGKEEVPPPQITED